MKAHPIELRQRIVSAVEQKTQTIEKIAILFDVSQRYVYKLLKRHRSGEDLAPKGHGGGAPAKLSEAHRSKLATFIEESPDATLEEIREFLRRRCRVAVSVSTVWRVVDCLDITVKKKTRRASEADPEERKVFIQSQPTLPTPRLWFIDEFGIHLSMSRRYARAPRGERAEVSEPFRTGGNISVISAIRLSGVECSMMIDGAIDANVLRAYVEQMLAPQLRAGDIVIWDNVPTHKNNEVISIIEATGACVKPLPAYSPDLNPKEECISKIKAALRAAKAATKLTLQRALKRAIESVTPQDIHGWYEDCGYSIP